MKRHVLGLSLLAVVAISCGGPSPYRDQALTGNLKPEAVYFIIDTSDSMNEGVSVLGGGRESKIEVAKRSLSDLAGTLADSTDLAVRSYPDPFAGECNSGVLLQPIGRTTAQNVRSEVSRLYATNLTPTAEALRAAARDIQQYGKQTTVVLLSDGLSSCDDPCDAARDLNRSTDWTVVTIGFDLGSDGSGELRCIANATEGQYLNVADGAELEALFNDPDRLFSVTG